MCECVSMIPGIATRPAASITVDARRAARRRARRRRSCRPATRIEPFGDRPLGHGQDRRVLDQDVAAGLDLRLAVVVELGGDVDERGSVGASGLRSAASGRSPSGLGGLDSAASRVGLRGLGRFGGASGRASRRRRVLAASGGSAPRPCGRLVFLGSGFGLISRPPSCRLPPRLASRLRRGGRSLSRSNFRPSTRTYRGLRLLVAVGAGQDDEVAELARLDRAEPSLEAGDRGGVAGQGGDGRLGREARGDRAARTWAWKVSAWSRPSLAKANRTPALRQRRRPWRPAPSTWPYDRPGLERLVALRRPSSCGIRPRSGPSAPRGSRAGGRPGRPSP